MCSLPLPIHFSIYLRESVESEEIGVEKLEKYREVMRYVEQGFNNSAIGRKCNLSRNTVAEYKKMDVDEFHGWCLSQQNRQKKLDGYKDVILNWLRKHPDLSAAQIYDWLQEKEGVSDVAENTVRNFVKELRDIYHIPKRTEERATGSVEELPPGQQMQVDFGQSRVIDSHGNVHRLYFVGFVLANSRYKYVEFLDRPFTTSDLIRMHENAFHYFGGMTEEIVYDQDRIILVSENSGDLVMTAEFTKYQQTRKFRVFMCRSSDPQTKGKIEQVVKYVKQNFMKHRIYNNLSDWQESCLRWLKRTGNYKVHHNTKKRPFEMHALEKQHLQKVSGTYIFEKVFMSSISRKIQKDNVIRYSGSRYSVPLGTFRKGSSNIAHIQVDKEKLYIRLQQNGEVIATHLLASERGANVIGENHRSRNMNRRDQLVQEVRSMIEDTSIVDWLVETLESHYPRHMTDQLKVVQKVFLQYPLTAGPAIYELKRLGLVSANDLRDIAISLEMESSKSKPKNNGVLNEKYKGLVAPERNDDIYVKVLKGGLAR